MISSQTGRAGTCSKLFGRGRGEASTARGPVVAPRHICFYGLTAAGKTTHATLLAQQLHMDYISASGLMYRKMGYRDPGDNKLWTRDMDEITALRQTGAVDEAVNEALLARAEEEIPAVFDSWTLPFMARSSPSLASNVLYIRLDSDISSRAIKCLVSQGPASRSSISDATNLIKGKDASSRDQFRSTFGIDISKSTIGIPAVNIIKLNVSPYVFGSSAEQIRHGIRTAHSLVINTVSQKFTHHTSKT
jgi:cytidylate kinase